MDTTPDHAIRDIESSRPQLKAGLKMAYREYAGEPGWLIEEPFSGRFFRVGAAEKHFIDQLDGRRTVAEIIAELSRYEGNDVLEAGRLEALIRALSDSGLLATVDGRHDERLHGEMSEEGNTNRLLGRASSALFLRLPLGNPDRFFRWAARRLGWLVSPGFAVLWLTVVVGGIVSVVSHWSMFQDQLRGVFAIDNLWLLGGLWIVLKAFHECWHGLVCRKYGGAVPEAGVSLLLLVTPLGYVDATSSTAFPSKWARMGVAGAGIYGELLLAAFAALVWARIEPGLLSSALHQVIVISSVTTILFNANPLMRFDGYYMLSDGLDIPNLAKRGQQMFSWLFRRWVLGVQAATYPLVNGERAWVISIYGILAAVWRVVVIGGLLVAATHLFKGVGLALAIIVGLAILTTNVQRWWKYLGAGARAEGGSCWRILVRLVLIAAIPVTLLSFVKIHPASKAAAVVRSSAGGEVRVSCPGFLTEIIVPPGMWVEAGDVVLRLDNPEQTAAFRQAEIEVKRSRLKIDHFRASEEIAALKAEERNLQALEQKVSELGEWIQSLELRAPRSGQVIGDSLAALRGNWMGRGQNLFTIGDPDSNEILILLPQDEIAAVGERLEKGSGIRFQSTGRPGSWGATIVSVTPSAVIESPHFALTVPGGGPLDVRRDNSERSDSYTLLKPHVEIHARINRPLDVRMFAGETGWALISSGERRTLFGLISDWLHGEMEQVLERQDIL